MKTLIFRNPTNGHIENCRYAMLWSLFSGEKDPDSEPEK
jgi:hypothetical protein